MNHNWLDIRMIALLGATVMLASCSNSSTSANLTQPDQAAQLENTEKPTAISTIELPEELPESEIDAEAVNEAIHNAVAETVSYDKEDVDSAAAVDQKNVITLNGSSAKFTGKGAFVKNNQITIALPGVYVISGQWDNGQIVVDLESKGTVQLVLNGATINNNSSAPIFVVNAKKTIITLQEGTENFITDGQNYVYEDAGDDEPSAAIYSKDDLVINGSGKLTVNGNYNDGIVGRDDLRITGGIISIVAVDDGLIGRDLLAIQDGQITIQAGGDGLKSTNDQDAAKGMIVLDGGNFQINAGSDGIQAETGLLITGGQYAITAGGGSISGGNEDGGKGLKATRDITITGGAFNIDSADDALHSNGSLVIASGALSIATGDDALHADVSATLSGGSILVTKSYEGLESEIVTITGGTIHLNTSDDGINIAGGADGSGFRGGPGQQSKVNSNSKLVISGGYVVVNAAGDGLDSNGNIEITGGTVIVNGPTTNGNGALDYDGTFIMSGGLLVAAGSSAMAEAPSDQSSQPSVMMYYSATQRAGTTIHLENSAGETVLTFSPATDYQSIVINSPLLKQGETYTLYTGGSASGSESDGLYTDGKYEGGTKLVSFTISDTVTYVNESGITTRQSGGFGGGGGGRGGRR